MASLILPRHYFRQHDDDKYALLVSTCNQYFVIVLSSLVCSARSHIVPRIAVLAKSRKFVVKSNED